MRRRNIRTPFTDNKINLFQEVHYSKKTLSLTKPLIYDGVVCNTYLDINREITKNTRDWIEYFRSTGL